MRLTRSQMRYILAIFRLSENKKSVRSSDLAKFLGITRPSVSRMLQVLSELQLLNKDSYGKISFTEAGRAFAEELREMAADVSCRLREALDLSSETADDCALLLLSELQTRNCEKQRSYVISAEQNKN